MAATADRLFVPGPKPREVWLTLGLSVLLHSVLGVGVILAPRFQVGMSIRVPVSYTVNLVDAPPGGRSSVAREPRAAPPPPARPAPEPVVRPAPPPARPAPPPVVPPAPAERLAPRSAPADELTLPRREAARRPVKPVPEPEPSLRLPSSARRETPRPAPSIPMPIIPAAPPVPATPPPVASSGASAGAAPAAVAGPVTDAGKGSGVELASPGAGAGGGDVLASYLTLVDWKILQNWVAVGVSGAPETVVLVRFTVLPSGQVRDIDLEATSGNASLDTSALRAVRQSLPLPPFPNLLTERSLDLRYRFVVER